MSHLLPIVERFPQATILCVGDVMLDKFIYGRIDRISPEAPIPVLLHQNEVEMLGGSGNVIRNIETLGGRSIFISVVGNDKIDQAIEAQLKNLKNCQFHLIQDNDRATTLKTRYIAANQQVLRIDQENIHNLSSHIEDNIFQHFCQHIDACDVVVLSDYGKGLFNPQLNHRLITEARLHHKPIIVDPKSHNFQDYKGATIITPNLKEFEAAVKAKVTDDIILKKHAEDMRSDANFEAILVTRGGDGMSLFAQDDHEYHLPTTALEVFDVSGAGDTVIASFALAYASKASLKDAMHIANYSAGIVVAKLGTSSALQAELIQCIKSHDVSNSSQSLHLTDALKQVKHWRDQGLKIGFTNGCFDILHPGHTSLLTEAKDQCDKLIVGLNSDRSVKELKGDKRPINSETDRAELLTQLRSVDLIVIFDEATPRQLIIDLKPDVLIKGKDYTVDQIAGAAEVIESGGEIYLADLITGKSTTNIISKF